MQEMVAPFSSPSTTHGAFGAQPAGPWLVCRTPFNRVKPIQADKTDLGAVVMKRQQLLATVLIPSSNWS
ncbi:hypothetical protein ALP06_200235 [Pseudomonas coronafaciens pv. atropurpurea]|nr:hypothetical protein ALP06_200235 [Pseudomonas coronafaciens pv. atropurpurea]